MEVSTLTYNLGNLGFWMCSTGWFKQNCFRSQCWPNVGGGVPIYYNITWHPAPNRARLGAAFGGVNLLLWNCEKISIAGLMVLVGLVGLLHRMVLVGLVGWWVCLACLVWLTWCANLFGIFFGYFIAPKRIFKWKYCPKWISKWIGWSPSLCWAKVISNESMDSVDSKVI